MKIICPHCGEQFELSDDTANQIRDQIRGAEFDSELEMRIKSIKESSKSVLDSEIAKAVALSQSKYEKQISKLEADNIELKTAHKLELSESNKALNDKITELSAQIKSSDESSQSIIDAKVSEAVAIERAKFEKKINSLASDKSKLESDYEKKLSKNIEIADKHISELESKLAVSDAKHELALETLKREDAVILDNKVSELNRDVQAMQKDRDYYKDLKAHMSTKMIGETLEQHCESEFNKIRMTAFPNAEFGKDNVVSKETGSKGDYIFREYDSDGIEIISIMFEMKNQTDETSSSSKKTNSYFFKELDKDRKEKCCEYAVLCSMLEENSELYNSGIVDVSYEYPKMYVIRPQFFIPIISLLRNAAISAHDSKRELIAIQNQNLDISKFKANFDDFKKGFGYNFIQAGKRLDEAVSEIDKAIARLVSVKEALTASNKQITLANKKVDNVDTEKLCKDSPMLLEELSEGENT